MTVFIADGAERASLAITRSLGKRGIEVHCGESYRFSTSSLSKYCKKTFVYPDPQHNCQTFIGKLLEILESGRYDVLYSSREVTTIPISFYKKDLEKYVIVPFPDYHQMMITHDKLRTIQIAGECGIPVPRTFSFQSIEDLKSSESQFEFPLVVKSRFKTLWKEGIPRMLKVTSQNYVKDTRDLIRITQEILHRSGHMPLIQEYIPGSGYGVEMLLNHGKPRAIFMHKRLHEYPITGGASTLRESIYREDLSTMGRSILQYLKWHGVAMVEFKIDERDNIPKLMEINGRFWGSLPLAIAAGVDFPSLLHQMILTGDVPLHTDYPTGIQSRWLLPGDILWFFSSLKEKKQKMRVLKEFLKFQNIHDDIISLSDPLPVLGALNASFHQFGDVIRGIRTMSGEVVRT
jgi:predicted ATP-grasp superfamily ATP-dependent carboligase